MFSGLFVITWRIKVEEVIVIRVVSFINCDNW